MPSQTFMAVQEEVGLKAKEDEPGPAHSRTFRMLQQQLKRSGWSGKNSLTTGKRKKKCWRCFQTITKLYTDT